jgi:hypothetical protein
MKKMVRTGDRARIILLAQSIPILLAYEEKPCVWVDVGKTKELARIEFDTQTHFRDALIEIHSMR